jgi:hypothetical protein
VASASSSAIYAFDPSTGSYERQGGIPGPVIGERAETIGLRRLSVEMSYSYVSLTSINGDDLDELENAPRIGNNVVSFRYGEDVTLKDGRLTTFLPVRVLLDIGVTAHIVTPGITYGVTPDLDVNLTLPIVHSALELSTRTRVPDPRLPDFALCPRTQCPGNATVDPTQGSVSLADSAAGLGDVLVRAKYVLTRELPVAVAAGLGVSLPTGDADDFHGRGQTHVQPTLIVSRVLADRVEPFANLGIDLDTEDAGRSIVRWALGATAQVLGPMGASFALLGRHELARQSEPIARPFFFQIERNDMVDAAVALRYRFAESGFLAANATVSLNDDGLRAAAIPTVQFQYAF